MKKPIPINLKRSCFGLLSFLTFFAFNHQVSAQYCTSTFSNISYEHITNVTMGSINNSSKGNIPNNDYTSLSTAVTPGEVIPVSVTIKPDFSEYIYVFIDWNHNGILDDAGEVTTVVANTSASGPHITTINVPMNAVSGTTRMRVILEYSSSFPDPCVNRTFGETEDYTLIVHSNASNDAGIASIVSPSSSCSGDYDVMATLKNFGKNQLNTAEIEWSVDGVIQAPYSYSGLVDTLNGQNPDQIEVTIGTTTFNSSSSVSQEIKAWISQANGQADTVNSNDTTLRVYDNIVPTITTYPYYEDFENGQAYWEHDGISDSWSFGTPAKTSITGAASGVNAFVNGGLNGNYNWNEMSYVTSPCFDLSQLQAPWVAMDASWDTDFELDGTVLQWSIDDGRSWQRIGELNAPYNWYNSEVIAARPGGQINGWSGQSNGWAQSKHPLPVPSPNQKVRFRVAFASDGFNEFEGFAFDNFLVVDYQEAELEVAARSLCGETSQTLDPGITLPGEIYWHTTGALLDSGLTYNVTQTGTYWFVYTDSMLNITVSDTIEIVQSTPPIIKFDNPIDTIHLGNEIILNPHLGPDLTYHWSPGNYDLPYLLVEGSKYGIGEHSFTLTVTDSLLCQDQSIVTVVVLDITGVDELGKDEIRFYPNPVHDRLNILLGNRKDAEIRLFDLQGRLLYFNPLSLSKSAKLEVDMSKLSPGTYLLQVGSGENAIIERIIRQ